MTKEHSRFGFVEFESDVDVDYVINIMNGISLFNKPIRVSRSGRDKKTYEIGANLFIGNLDSDVDEKYLTETFSYFGQLIGPAKVMRDDTGDATKSYAFVYYDSFESSDSAISAMNDQFFGNRRITVTYAFKKDKPGERHGDATERLLASKNPLIKHKREMQQQSILSPYAQNYQIQNNNPLIMASGMYGLAPNQYLPHNMMPPIQSNFQSNFQQQQQQQYPQ